MPIGHALDSHSGDQHLYQSNSKYVRMLNGINLTFTSRIDILYGSGISVNWEPFIMVIIGERVGVARLVEQFVIAN